MGESLGQYITTYKVDSRKFLFGVFISVLLFIISYFSNTTSITIAFGMAGVLFFLSISLQRHIVSTTSDSLIITNRFNIFAKKILLKEISKVRVIETPYEPILTINNLFYLLIWDKKFKQTKKIDLYDIYNRKLYSIDGQAIQNEDYVKLIKDLKR